MLRKINKGRAKGARKCGEKSTVGYKQAGEGLTDKVVAEQREDRQGADTKGWKEGALQKEDTADERLKSRALGMFKEY